MPRSATGTATNRATPQVPEPRAVGAAAPPGTATPRLPAVGGRIAVLDGLRLLAAAAVVGKHWIGSGVAAVGENGRMVHAWNARTTEDIFGPLHTPMNYGWLGVNLFFLISGFVICMSAWGRGLGRFFTSRVARLFPAYWFAVSLTVAVALLLPGLTGGTPAGGESDALVNLTMVQRAFGVRDVDPSYWTLWVELRFYLLFAVVVGLGLTYRRVVAFCMLWTVAAVAAAGTGGDLLGFVAMPRYASYFVAGVAFYLIYRFGPSLLLWGVVCFSWLLSVHYLPAAAVGHMRYNGVEASTPVLVAVVTASYAVLAVVALRRCDRIRWRWLTVAGALSYPLYLLHQVLGFVAIHYLRDRVPPLILVAALFGAALALAWLVWRFVERPMGRLLTRGLTTSLERIRRPEDAPAVGR